MLVANPRVKTEDQRFANDEKDTEYKKHIFVRLVSMNIVFQNVDFSYCIFDGCYLRKCKFIKCNFTGCKFLSTSFHGSLFNHCTFDYATFEKTIIADDILNTQAPERENLKAWFARSLRVNYQQLGEAESVNKAIKVELSATRTHLSQAWRSNSDYYREKYAGFKRVTSFLRWSSFTILQMLWGNGESVPRLVFSVFGVFVLMAIYYGVNSVAPGQIVSYWRGLGIAPEVFLGVRSFPAAAYWYLTAVITARLLFFAALVSILLKRFNRR
jgi:Pentapeptide repeats (9 copies)